MNSILIYNYKHYNTATLGKSKIQRKFASLLTNLEIYISFEILINGSFNFCNLKINWRVTKTMRST